MRTTALPLPKLLLLLLSVTCVRHVYAGNGLNRCVGGDGTSIFTDQKCEDIGAATRADPPPMAGNIGFGRLRANICARRPEELLDDIESAINAGDVNQIAAFYHWPGVSSVGSTAIFKRLQGLIDHPLLSIDLLYAQESQEGNELEPAVVNSPRRAYALQIVQNHSERDTTPIRNTLSLRRNIGCWWVQF